MTGWRCLPPSWFDHRVEPRLVKGQERRVPIGPDSAGTVSGQRASCIIRLSAEDCRCRLCVVQRRFSKSYCRSTGEYLHLYTPIMLLLKYITSIPQVKACHSMSFPTSFYSASSNPTMQNYRPRPPGNPLSINF
jgi:hypothetical protein